MFAGPFSESKFTNASKAFYLETFTTSNIKIIIHDDKMSVVFDNVITSYGQFQTSERGDAYLQSFARNVPTS